MKQKLLLPAFLILIILVTSFLLSGDASGQSCSNNNIGFNSNTATDILTVCAGSPGNTIDGGIPAGSPVYQWQVSSSSTGPFSNVSPDPGSVTSYTITSNYYGTSGTYFFRRVVSGSSGCDGNSDAVRFVVKFIPIVTNNGGNSSSCAPTGFITLYGSGGVTPYTYSLDGITYQSGNTFNSLAAGTYTGYVKDAFGCIGTKPGITITAAAPIVVTASARKSSACTNDGSIDLFRTGGVGPYTYSIDDVTYQSSNTISNLAPGTYTGWVKDSKGCKSSLGGIVVGTYTAVSVTSATTSNTAPCGPATGSLRIFASGGVPAYTYSLDDITYQSSSTFTGLAAGTYTGWAKDMKGCKASLGAITVGTDPAPTITVTANPHGTGSSANNGTIQLYNSGGGTSPFTYSLDDITYQSSTLFTGLAGGTYTGWVKDSKGCKGSVAGIVVTQSPVLTITESHTATGTCTNSGTIQLHGAGGAPGYTFSIDDITYQASMSFSALAAGSYTGWVKDQNGCKASVGISISAVPILPTSSVTNASNCMSTNGVIQLFRTGGTAPYTYSLGGVTYQSSNSFTGLTPGTYTGYVKDSKGCIGSLASIIVGPPIATISLTSGSNAQVVCSNSAISSITYTVGGTGTGAGVTGLPTGVTGSFSAGLFTISGTPTVAGTFNYTVTTTGGACLQANATGTITVNGAPAATFTKTMASSCGSGNDGTITVTASGGTAPYTYSWTGPGGYTASTAAITALATGDYTIVVTDAASCSKTIPAITIWQAQTPALTNNGANTASCSNTGNITLYGNSGVPPYTYSIDGVNYQSGNSFTSLGAGTYTGYIKDHAGCVGTRPNIVVNSLAPISVTAYARTASSCAATDGSIQLFRTGGAGPYTYSLDGVTYQSGNLFTGLGQGTYTGYVKDASGCVGTLTNIVVGPGCARPATARGNSGKAEILPVDIKMTVRAYPNPSSSSFKLVLSGGSHEKVRILVTDYLGRSVYQDEGTASQVFNFGDNFKPGIYNVQVTQGTEKRIVKLIRE